MRLAAAACLLLGACTPHIAGSVAVDGRPFAATTCRAGEATGFSGADFYSADGRKLRLVYHASAQAIAYLFDPGAATGVEVGPCGAMTLERQHSRINHIHNVRGSAQLSCAGAGRTVVGQLEFENCH